MRAIPLIVATVLIAACPAVGRASGLRLCNQSFDVLNVAIGTPQEAGGMRTRGWWRVAPNQCATLLRDALRGQPYHIFAADVFGNEVLTGSIPMCVAPRRFDISGQKDCLLRGFLDARFIAVDTQGQQAWTVFVTPRPD